MFKVTQLVGVAQLWLISLNLFYEFVFLNSKLVSHTRYALIAFLTTENFLNHNLQINVKIWEINEIALLIRIINICGLLMTWS